MKRNKIIDPFFISIFLGLAVWLLVYWIIPVHAVKPVTKSSMAFIGLSYLFLAAGYIITPKFSFKSKKNTASSRYIWIVITTILIGFLFRYIDLIVNRDLSFSNTIDLNRKLAENSYHSSLLLIAAVPRYLFFAPLILVLVSKSKSKLLLILSAVLFLLPLIEAILRGSRGPFLISFSLFLAVLLFFNKLRINYKTVLALGVSFLLLVWISSAILAKREGEKNQGDMYRDLITEAKYNDLLAPNQSFYDWYDSSNNVGLKIGAVNFLHIGQYYTHSVFEFNNLQQQENLKKQYGKYTFYLIPKLLNFLEIANYDLSKISASHPRGYTFIGFLGGMYIDWGWFSLLFLFFFGVFQKLLRQLSLASHFEVLPLYIYVLFGNFFMLTFNFYKGNGTTILIVCVIFALLNNVYRYQRKMSKNISDT